MKKSNFNTDLFKSYYESYDFSKKIKTWKQYSNRFKEIWKNKINNGSATKTDFDEIVFLIDANARGRTKNDEVVAKTYIRYGTWYRTFGDITSNIELRSLMNKILSSTDYDEIIKLLNELAASNEKNKNGLTGESGIILNSLLFLNNPELFICSVSLRHRIDIIKYFSFDELERYEALSYGEKIIRTNEIILNGFKSIMTELKLYDSVDSFIFPRFISEYIYTDSIRNSIWKKNDDEGTIDVTDDNDIEKQNFYLEKYLEDFLYTNWESTELGKKYEIIVEKGEPVSLQYQTDIGKIDLLVKDKSSGDYLVIELKKSQASDDTIGQVTRYMGWVKRNLAGNKKVKGLIIAESFDDKIKYSLDMVKDIELMSYHIQFKLKKES
ncbi:MAG: endonuclease NucS domain-containing protein [Spirochaetota bacterium]